MPEVPFREEAVIDRKKVLAWILWALNRADDVDDASEVKKIAEEAVENIFHGN